MAVKIRLTRHGAKKRPFYRIVIADSRFPRDGRFIEIVGHYNPTVDPPEVVLKNDRISYWISKGVKPTDTVGQIMKRASKTENDVVTS